MIWRFLFILRLLHKILFLSRSPNQDFLTQRNLRRLSTTQDSHRWYINGRSFQEFHLILLQQLLHLLLLIIKRLKYNQRVSFTLLLLSKVLSYSARNLHGYLHYIIFLIKKLFPQVSINLMLFRVRLLWGDRILSFHLLYF